LTWANGLGEEGRVDLPASYAIGTAYYFHLGLSVALSAGNTAAADTFTVDAYALMAHRRDARFLSAQIPDGVAVGLGRVSRASFDVSSQSFAGRIFVLPSVIQRNPELSIEPITDAEKEKLDHIESGRQELMVGENLDLDTVFLLKGGGIHPLVGAPVTHTRSDVLQPYKHPRTGLWRKAAANELPVERGLNGPAMLVSTQNVTNLDARFHAKDAASGPTAGWTTHAGAPAYFYDENVKGTLDPDGGWDADTIKGTLRVDFDAAEATRSNTEPSITAGNQYVAAVSLRGRGEVRVAMWDLGGGTSELDFETVVLDGTDEFQEVHLTGTAATSATMHLRITATEKSIVWISWKMQALGFVSAGPVETLGATASTVAADLALNRFTLPQNGTFSCFFRMPPGGYDPSGNPCPIFEEISAGHFLLRYDANGNRIRFALSSGAILNLNLSPDLSHETWYHLAATWEHSTTANEVQLALYLRGPDAVLQTATTSATWAHPPTSGPAAIYKIGKSFAAHRPLRDWLFKEVRIDRRPWTAAEVLDQYERGFNDEWTHHTTEFGGRGFRITRSGWHWIADTVNPHLLRASLSLRQSSTHEDSVAIAR
jgi:hypothetical protein